MTFSSAKKFCQSKGAILPEPRTESMRNLMRQSEDFPYYFWLGLTDIANEGQYVWESDNSTVSDFDWKEGFPLGGKDHNCVLRSSTGWRDLDCSRPCYIFCQKRE